MAGMSITSESVVREPVLRVTDGFPDHSLAAGASTFPVDDTENFRVNLKSTPWAKHVPVLAATQLLQLDAHQR